MSGAIDNQQRGTWMLSGKRILLIVCGGIAAYKSLDLIRRLRERGAHVRPVMTQSAQHFVTPLSLATLSGEKVHTELFSLTDETEIGHIELSRSADLIVVAPATANIAAKLAHGIADDLASTLLLATDTKILMAPAMNLRMWLHPATQSNFKLLQERGIAVCGPADGAMACGEFGPGRMSEPLEIVASIERLLGDETKLPLPLANVPMTAQAEPLAGKHVIVTSGPTHEAIDPVRYIANRSSGKQGYAIAAQALAAGARVTLISGPVNLPAPAGVELVRVESALQMHAAAHAALPADIFVAAAAVADWRATAASKGKIKKGSSGPPKLDLEENPDILASVASLKKGRPFLVIGFAAETDDVKANGAAKLNRKKCDMIVANDVRPESGVMGGDSNSVHLITKSGVETWPELPKGEVARRLVARLASMMRGAGQ